MAHQIKIAYVQQGFPSRLVNLCRDILDCHCRLLCFGNSYMYIGLKRRLLSHLKIVSGVPLAIKLSTWATLKIHILDIC